MKQNRHRRQKSKAAERELELEPERTEVRERETHTHTKRNLLASPTIAGGSFKNIFPKGIRKKKKRKRGLQITVSCRDSIAVHEALIS